MKLPPDFPRLQLPLPLPEALPARLAVGWSGGADSTALLLTLAGAGYEVHAWHVDHAWHEKSAMQAEQLAAQAAAWGIPFRSIRLPVASGANREAAARAGRFAAFNQLASEQRLTDICLAHHRNDQAETVCMRMLQGAGVHGIRGMQAVRQRGSLNIFRPFLHLSRSEICAALNSAGVACLEDASNDDLTLWRNKLRQHLFPRMQRAAVDPTELFLRWQQQAVRIAAEIEAGVAPVQVKFEEECCSLAWRDWALLSPVLRASLLQRMMQHLFGEGTVAGRRHIELIEKWIGRGGSGGLDLSRSRLLRKDGRLYLTRKLTRKS